MIPTVGSVVLIKDSLPRGNWKYGKILNLIQSGDGLIRSAEVETSSKKVLRRPLCLLYPWKCVKQGVMKYLALMILVRDKTDERPVRKSKVEAKKNLKR